MKGAVSVQKALQVSEKRDRQMLGGTKGNSVLPKDGLQICFSGRSMIFLLLFFAKDALEARPGFLQSKKAT